MVTTDKDKKGKIFIADPVNASFFDKYKLSFSPIAVALDPYGNLLDKLLPQMTSSKILSFLDTAEKKFIEIQTYLNRRYDGVEKLLIQMESASGKEKESTRIKIIQKVIKILQEIIKTQFEGYEAITKSHAKLDSINQKAKTEYSNILKDYVALDKECQKPESIIPELEKVMKIYKGLQVEQKIKDGIKDIKEGENPERILEEILKEIELEKQIIHSKQTDNPEQPKQSERQCKIDEAIRKGAEFLIKGEESFIQMFGKENSNLKPSGIESELVFYTLIKSGIKIPEPLMKIFLDEMLSKKLENTYRVALLAMALTELDKVKYLKRIVQCAEFLLANQSARGAWGYSMITPPNFINTNIPNPITSTEKTSTKSVRIIQIKIPQRGPDVGWDTSIAQFAVLGLRACADAGIEIPQEVWCDAEKMFSLFEHSDGAWNCHGDSPVNHNMTVAGIGSLAICLFYQNKNIQEDARIKKAIDWLVKHFNINGYTEDDDYPYPYYYIYGLERAGTLVGTESFGKYQWYPLGVDYLLKEQNKDGSWNASDKKSGSGKIRIDTCFAILFLKRATNPLKIVTTPTSKIVITDGKDGQGQETQEGHEKDKGPEEETK